MNVPVSVGLAVAVAAVAILLGLKNRELVARSVRDFFAAEAHPVNLAVFRLVLFGLVAFLAWEWWLDESLLAFGELPAALRFPPLGTGWLLEQGWVDPVLTPTAIGAGVLALAVTSTAAAFGLATRLMAAVAAVLAVYVLGVPQLFGKVNHGHHLVWFAFLLAASPSGDALSLDRAIRRWRAKRRGAEPPALTPSRAYGFPLRIAWLLIGVVYLFPAVHKYATHGLKWALSDNLANRVLVHHVVAGRELPGWVGAIEPMLPLLAVAALALEGTFILLLFSDRLRPYAVLGMLAFHIGTRVLLRIWFFHLVAMYVVFVDWHGLAGRLRARWRRGSAPERPMGREPRSMTSPRGATLAVAAVLLVGAVWTGARAEVSGWPFAAYPTFANLQQPVIHDLDVEVARDDGAVQRVTMDQLVPWLSPERLQGMTHSILGASDRERRLAALWELVETGDGISDPDEVAELRFYRVRRDLRTEETQRELIHAFQPA